MSRFELSILLAVTGKYHWVEGELADTLSYLETRKELPIQTIAICDGAKWLTTPLLQTFPVRFGTTGKLDIEPESHLPAALFNRGAHLADAHYLLMIWPGCRPNIEHILDRRFQQFEPALYAWLDSTLLENMHATPELVLQWREHLFRCHNLFRLSDVVISRRGFLEQGGFDCNRLMQRNFDWEFWLRVTRAGLEIKVASGTVGNVKWDWTIYPIEQDYRIPKFTAQNYCLASSRSTLRATGPRALEDRVAAKRQDSLEEHHKAEGRIRAAVISGLYDYVHSQLCFFNYLDSTLAADAFQYISLLDVLVEPERDLQALDLVIISRGRVENIYRVLEYCKKHHVPTLYMLDDNWLWAGRDWSEHYGTLFQPGSQAYEVFTTALKECTAVLVYNKLLAEDVSRFAKRVIQLPTNVHQETFRRPLKDSKLGQRVTDLNEWRSQSGGLIVGYAGSIRYLDVAFEALAMVSRKYRGRIRVLLFGYLLPNQLQLFDEADIVSIPYVSYQEYASTLNSLQPDILIAPLDDSRTSMSKAPNKYIEYSIVGAAGIYSRVYPYTEAVQEGVTGLLVSNQLEAWERAITNLIGHTELREKLAQAARADILAHYETGIVAAQFIQALKSVARKKENEILL